MRTPRLLLIALSACVTDYQVTELPAEIVEPDTAAMEAPPADEEPPPVVEEPPPPADEAPPVVEEPPVDTDPPPPPDDCVGTSDLVYVLSREDDALWTFDPASLTMQRLGELDCTPWGDPASMGIARDGVAYVRYSDDAVYEVDLTTLACAPTGYRPGRTGFGAFGMGYATHRAGTWMDTLYVANHRALARLDTATWQLTTLGSLPSQPELTGNANGELWAFLPLEQPARLSRLDKQTAAPLQNINLPGFPSPFDIDAFAFAAWAGEFWLFVREYGVGRTTDVYRVDAQGRMVLMREDLGINVVGAGASTCAPPS